MNASNNDTILGNSGCPSPNGSDRNNSVSRMMFDKNNEGSIDDLNFNESLDAFLYSENLNDVTTPIQTDVMVPDGVNMRNATMATNTLPVLMNGVLQQSALQSSARAPDSASSGAVFSSLPSIPYNIALPGQPACASPVAQASYSTSMPYSQTPLAPQPYATVAPKPSVESSADNKAGLLGSEASSGKRKAEKSHARTKRMREDATEVSEDEDERSKRRYGRNLREQQRSQKITQQIDHLREVLSGANITFKPDKYSTLVTVAEYIKQLQAKSAALDAEHEKLLSTISKTNEIVNDRYLPASTTGENPPGGANLAQANCHPIDGHDTLVPNIDYRSVFKSCGVPLAVASIDGRFVDCNLEFLKVTGYSRQELLPFHHSIPEEVPSIAMQQGDVNKNLSLFNLLHRDHMEGVFIAMSEMLKKPPRNDGTKPLPGEDCWAGYVYLTRQPQIKMRMNVTLVRGSRGGAKFFDCSLLPVPNG